MAKQKKVPQTGDYLDVKEELRKQVGLHTNRRTWCQFQQFFVIPPSIWQICDAEKQVAEKAKEIERLLLKIYPPVEDSGRFLQTEGLQDNAPPYSR